MADTGYDQNNIFLSMTGLRQNRCEYKFISKVYPQISGKGEPNTIIYIMPNIYKIKFE